MSSPGPLSGAKRRPCTVACRDKCIEDIMKGLDRGRSWTNWENGTLHLCDAHSEWERGREKIFDRMAGSRLTSERKRVWKLKVRDCGIEFEEMRRRTANWKDVLCVAWLNRYINSTTPISSSDQNKGSEAYDAEEAPLEHERDRAAKNKLN
ncbi:hypothetical protein CDL15_Pgr018856 [Punica granatum]|uniref:DUF7796 domain-containing protein n=1 Tax=Punica granatum TaxID=22663 RepID=A0A218VUQ6_PUNGR|nr:hypothetical protein CDL15_Pgr018856 [Punica granatum]